MVVSDGVGWGATYPVEGMIVADALLFKDYYLILTLKKRKRNASTKSVCFGPFLLSPFHIADDSTVLPPLHHHPSWQGDEPS